MWISCILIWLYVQLGKKNRLFSWYGHLLVYHWVKLQTLCSARFSLILHVVHAVSCTCTGVSWGLLTVLHFLLDTLKQNIWALGLGAGPDSSPRFWVINAASAQGLQGLLKQGSAWLDTLLLLPPDYYQASWSERQNKAGLLQASCTQPLKHDAFSQKNTQEKILSSLHCCM